MSPNRNGRLVMHRRKLAVMASASVLFLALVVWGCAQKAPGPQAVSIDVTDRGFVPAEAKVHAGEPVTLLVTRRTDATCAKEIVIADEGIRRSLPLNEVVRIEFTPKAAGEIRYACGMGMVSGTLKVQ